MPETNVATVTALKNNTVVAVNSAQNILYPFAFDPHLILWLINSLRFAGGSVETMLFLSFKNLTEPLPYFFAVEWIKNISSPDENFSPSDSFLSLITLFESPILAALPEKGRFNPEEPAPVATRLKNSREKNF